MAIKLLKLITGEEVIAKVTEKWTDAPGAVASARFTGYEAKDVRTVTRLPISGPQGVQFVNVLAPYWGGAQKSDNLALDREHIVQIVEPDDELVKVYTKETTGIVVARR